MDRADLADLTRTHTPRRESAVEAARAERQHREALLDERLADLAAGRCDFAAVADEPAGWAVGLTRAI